MEAQNIVLKNIIYDDNGYLIGNKKEEVLCEVENDNGETCLSYVPSSQLEQCGLRVSPQVSQNNTPVVSAEQAASQVVTNVNTISLPTCQLWKTCKAQTPKDQEATLILLDLRKEYEKEFVDKKTAKNLLWTKIAKRMNDMGCFVGEGTEGREKVRQKFANLQASYLKYYQKRKQTGEGGVQKPPYYDELDIILGDKHKITPPIIIDSEEKENGTKHDNTVEGKKLKPLDSNATDITAPGPSHNRFTSIKTSVRPTKERVVDVLKEIHKETIEQRKTEFATIVNLLREENKQRHAEIMAMISSSKEKNQKQKRKREESNDSDG